MPPLQRLLYCALILACVVVPAHAADVPDLTGTWTWTWKGPNDVEHKHTLIVEGTNAKLAAREQFDDLAPVLVRDLALSGSQLKFTVVRGEQRAEYRGVVDDSRTINGKVVVTRDGQPTEFVWKARRQEAEKSVVQD